MSARRGATAVEAREQRALGRPLPEAQPPRIVIEAVEPAVDGGRHPVKRVEGEELEVSADIFADGHVVLRAQLLHRAEHEREWRAIWMEPLDDDRWSASFTAGGRGCHFYTVRAWIDPFRSWRRDLEKRLAAGQQVAAELPIGAAVLERLAEGVPADLRRALEPSVALLREETGGTVAERARAALAPELLELVDRLGPIEPAMTHAELPLTVDPVLARFSAWYEMFPRSAAPEPGVHGTLRDVEARLPYVAELGFDVLYLPPIHPIGRTLRKGPNNSLQAGPGDPGSPWAIGAREGGHTAVHPELGTEEDLARLAKKARDEHGIELALDVAFQTSPDHPWVREHDTWFRKRPDGSIQYAENPPKKYEDIYPIDFDSPDWRELWQGLRDVFQHWIDLGVKVFRVDNPHTKSLAFWEWCIGDLKARHPETIFLSEAFTRPKLMRRLAKVGFTQSYTYFPWRNDAEGLREYLTELTQTPVREYFRPNHWPNTPDILTEYLQHGGRAAFVIRLVLAATLGASYGIYGPAFELCEGRALREGSEEYLDSEKYQIRRWDLDDPRSLRHVIARLNRVRRENPALQQDRTLRFHQTDNELLLCYSKTEPDESGAILVVVNLDPHHRQSGWLWLDLFPLGIRGSEGYQAHDLLSDARFLWRDESNFVELDPAVMPAHVFRIRRRLRTEHDFDYFL